MRGTKAKILRRRAEGMTTGMPAGRLVPDRHTRRTKPIHDALGNVVSTYQTVTMRHDEGTTRHVYKALKRDS